MPLDTLIFDASACGFPKSRVSLLPVGLDGVSLASGRHWTPAGHFRHFARGRYALREACPTALDYRLRLLHLPCHQSLSPAQLDWMIAAVQRVPPPASNQTGIRRNCAP
jgi:hypothetical protein